MTSGSEIKDVEFEEALDFDAVLAAARSWKHSFAVMTYSDEDEDCCTLTQQSFKDFLAQGEGGKVLHISLDNETGLVISRSNSEISSGWERVEIEDAQEGNEVTEGQPNLPADLSLADEKRRSLANWLARVLGRESKISPAEPQQMEDGDAIEDVMVPDGDKEDLKDGEAAEPVEVKPKDSALERSCQVCRGLLRLHQPAPFAYWSCDGCGSRNLRKDAMWGCSHPDTCDWGLCTGCHPDKVLDTAFVSDFHAPLAGMFLTGLMICSASRFCS